MLELAYIVLLSLWVCFVILIPGLLVLIAVCRERARTFPLLVLILMDLAFGIYYVAITGYLLDIFASFSLSNLVFVTTIFNILGSFCLRRYVTEFLTEIMRPSRLKIEPSHAISILALCYLSIQVFWTSLGSPFLYPSDPVYWLFRGRYLLANQNLVVSMYKAMEGRGMTRPLGFDYLLGTLFSIEGAKSYDLIHIIGPLSGTVGLLSVYLAASMLTGSRLAGVVSSLFMATDRTWVYQNVLTTPGGVTGFIVPLLLIVLYDAISNRSSKKLRDSLLPLSLLASTIWLLHPPTLVAFAGPAVVWLVVCRKGASGRALAWFALLFAVLTLPYWFFLNQNSFGERLEVPTAKTSGVKDQWFLLSFQDLLFPFQEGSSLSVALMVVGVFAFLLWQRLTNVGEQRDNQKMLTLLVAVYLMQYAYCVNPIVPLKQILTNTIPETKMVLFMTNTGAILCGFFCFLLYSSIKKAFSGSRLMLSGTRITAIGLRPRRVLTGVLLLSIAVMILTYQYAWGTQSFNRVPASNPYVTREVVELILWMDSHLPQQATVVFDDVNTIALIDKMNTEAIANHPQDDEATRKIRTDYMCWLEIGQWASNVAFDRERGPSWLAYAALYPRRGFASNSLFADCEGSRVDLVEFLNATGVDYVVLTMREKWPKSSWILSQHFDVLYSGHDVVLFRTRG